MNKTASIMARLKFHHRNFYVIFLGVISCNDAGNKHTLLMEVVNDASLSSVNTIFNEKR